MIFANRRSLASPKRVDSQRMLRRQASQMSALIAMAVLTVSSGVAAAIFGLCFWLHVMWALTPLFAIFATVGVMVYLQSLNSVDRYAMEHREDLLLELCKTS